MKSIPSVLIGFINLFLFAVELFLGLRFLLRLFGANVQAPFVQFIYSSSTPLLEPFRGIFPVRVIESGMVMEFSTLFAILMYALFAYLIMELIAWVARITRLPSH